MTCIAGVVEKGQVWIGGDSAGVAGWTLRVRADEKVFRNGDFLFGFCGSFRMGQLLRHAFRPPDHDPRVPLEQFLATTFIDAVRTCLKQGGYASKKDEEESGGTFLLGYAGRLFGVEADYQVGEVADGFAAIGCGDQVAMGALYAATVLPARERLTLALEAAERFSAGVRGPFRILDLAPAKQAS